jgi:thioredoxin 1
LEVFFTELAELRMKSIAALVAIASCFSLVAGCESSDASLNDDNFDQLVLEADQPVLVDFYADWCGPCKQFAPTVDQLAADFEGRAIVAKLDVDAAKETARKYRVLSIPTVIIFKDGREVERFVGGESRERLTEALEDAIQGAGDDDGSGGQPAEPPHVSDADFETKVLKSDQPVLVDFYADWCAPCRTLAPTIARLADEYEGKARVVKLNIDDSPETMLAYGVESVPTLIVFKGGEEFMRFVELTDRKELAKALDAAMK